MTTKAHSRGTASLAVAVLIVLLSVVPLFVPAQSGSVQADTGTQVVFVEDFESPETVEANWSAYGSAFSVSGSVGTLLPDGSVVPIWSNHKATIHDKGADPIMFQDLVYEVDVKLTLAIRTALCFGLDAQGRRFWVGYDTSSAGLWCNNDLENDGRSVGVCSTVEDYRPPHSEWHHWRVEVSGDQFDFWVDSHHVLTGQLAGYLPGPIGMRSWDAGGSQFDNLIAAGQPYVPPSQPSNVFPTGIRISLTPTLISSAFSDNAGDTHVASHWQIATAAGGYATPVFDSGTDNKNLTEIGVPSGKLTYSTAYYWRVRHQASSGAWSAWSAETSFTTGDQAILNGLVSWWPGEGNCNDAVGSNDGAPMNGVAFASGKAGQSFSFDGVDDYVMVADSRTLDLATGSTFAMWVKLASYPPPGKHAVLLNKWSSGREDKGLVIGQDGRVSYYLFGTSTSSVLESNGVIGLGNWYQIAATYDGSTVRIYVNGQPDASNTATGDVGDANGILHFGYNPDRASEGAASHLAGQIDEIRWYNRALSQAEIEAMFDSTNQAPGRPNNISPANSSAGIRLTPTLVSSAFSESDGAAHAASQWQMTSTSGNYSTPLLDSGPDTASLTSKAIPAELLTYSTTYYWRVRHQDNDGIWSDWSAETSFTTAGPAGQTGSGISFAVQLLVGTGAVLMIGMVALVTSRALARREK